MKSALYKGIVRHRRLRPVEHMLKYQMFYVVLDLDELDLVAKKCRLFSVNKFNILSFWPKDFGDFNERDLKTDIAAMVQSKIDDVNIKSIRLLCIPRLFGYAFNPISAYFCYDDTEDLRAIVYEVRNTFGEKIHYVLPAEKRTNSNIIEHDCAKEMYVSPFMGMNCHYHFKIAPPEEVVTLSIQQTEDSQPILNASFSGIRMSLTDFVILKQIALFPVNSLKVIAGIHFEALKLWIKGVPLKTRITKAQITRKKLHKEKGKTFRRI